VGASEVAVVGALDAGAEASPLVDATGGASVVVLEQPASRSPAVAKEAEKAISRVRDIGNSKRVGRSG